jgi:HECT-domain (ubiquitin-transferase)
VSSASEFSNDELTYICNRRENDITDVIDETFTTVEDRFGELVTIELKEGGADVPVTEENKKEYVEYVIFTIYLSRLTDTPLVLQRGHRVSCTQARQGAVRCIHGRILGAHPAGFNQRLR